MSPVLKTREDCADAIREVLAEAMGLLPNADHPEVRDQIDTSKGVADALASLAHLLPDRGTEERIRRLEAERDTAREAVEKERRVRSVVHDEQRRVSEIVQAELGVPSRDGLAGGLRGLVARVKAGSGSFDRDDAIQFFAYLERVTTALERVDTILNLSF